MSFCFLEEEGVWRICIFYLGLSDGIIRGTILFCLYIAKRFAGLRGGKRVLGFS